MKDQNLKEEFLKLVNQHISIIHKITRLYEDTEEDRRDLFQEILLNLWKGYRGFRQEATFGTWLYRVALNTAITGLRKRRRQAGLYTLEDKHDKIPDEVREVNMDEIEILYDAISQLDKLERAIIILYLEEKSYEEIADIVGITANNTGVKINRIKSKLEKMLTGQRI
jgi:RNA polymerase sigma factor (sigma-70 family)